MFDLILFTQLLPLLLSLCSYSPFLFILSVKMNFFAQNCDFLEGVLLVETTSNPKCEARGNLRESSWDQQDGDQRE
jgi:hypothetical protein